jgi:hypothetical protein
MSYLLELIITLGVWIALKKVNSIEAMKQGLLVVAQKKTERPL